MSNQKSIQAALAARSETLADIRELQLQRDEIECDVVRMLAEDGLYETLTPKWSRVHRIFAERK